MAEPAADSAAAPLRVWLACDWFVKYAAGLARGLADVGCEVDFLTRDHDQEFGEEAGAMRAFVAATLDGEARHLELGGRVRSLAGLRASAGLRRLFAAVPLTSSTSRIRSPTTCGSASLRASRAAASR